MSDLSAADIAEGRRLLGKPGSAGPEWVWANLPALLDTAEKLAAIGELHTPDAGHDPECDCGVPAGADQDCNECCSEWPCATIRAINPEEAVSGE